MTLNNLKGLKVLVTGHTGFKGSWLSLMLSELGAELHGIALEAQEESMFNICRIGELYKSSSIVDIRLEKDFFNTFKAINPDVIFHLAAQPIVSIGYQNSFETFSTNVIGTVNLLESVRSNPKNIKGIVIVTSDKCYENKGEIIEFNEDSPLGGDDPYSASKACAEIVSASYYKSFLIDIGIGLATARAGNVIGGGDFSIDRLVPDFFRAFKSDQDLNIRNRKTIRPWQHVIDPVYGYLLLASKMIDDRSLYSGPWNFAPESSKTYSVGDLIDKFSKHLPVKINEVPSTYVESNYLALNSSKAKNNLNWNAFFDIDSTVNLTIDWYRKYLQNPQDLRDFSISQLSSLKL
jgi:CDP-glucose 4,6-dehydratase